MKSERTCALRRRWAFVVLVACLPLQLAGCGGGNSMDEMRRNAIRRPKDDEPPAVAEKAIPAADPTNLAAAAKPDAVANKDTPQRTDAALPVTGPTQVQQPNSGSPDNAPPAEVAAAKPKSEAQLRKEATIENLTQLGNAMNAYVKANGCFPSSTNSGLSWRVALLPYLGKKSLYEQFDMQASWEDEPNKALLDQMPDVFRSPLSAGHLTTYLMVTGKGAIQQSGARIAPKDLDGGICLAIVEVPTDAAVPWTQPSDYAIRHSGIAESLGGVSEHGSFAVTSEGRVVWVSDELANHDLSFLLYLTGEGSRRLLRPPSDALSLIEKDLPKPVEEVAAIAAPESMPVEVVATSSESPTPEAASTPAPKMSAPSVKEIADRFQVGSPGLNSSSQRTALPDRAALKSAHDLMRELYRQQYVEAKTNQKRIELARRMWERLSDVAEDLPGQFALLETVKQIAVVAGEVELAMKAAEQLEARFDFGGDGLLLETLTALGKTAEDSSNRRALVDRAERLYVDYIQTRSYAKAVTVSQLALAVVKKMTDSALEAKWSYRRSRAEEARKAFVAAERGLKTLETSSEDAEASTAVGRFLCIYAADWENGIPILANSNDRSLQRIADLELRHSASAEERLKIADLWWKEADLAHAVEKAALQQRAGYWYSEALNGLPAGLVRIRVERRIAELESDS